MPKKKDHATIVRRHAALSLSLACPRKTEEIFFLFPLATRFLFFLFLLPRRNFKKEEKLLT
jgi:hypothetical protein